MKLMVVEVIAVAIGVGVVLVIAIASMTGARPQGRREGGDGPIIPIGRLGDDNDDVGLS
jgi:hypothetical protein